MSRVILSDVAWNLLIAGLPVEKRSPEGCAPIPYMMHDGSTAVFVQVPLLSSVVLARRRLRLSQNILFNNSESTVCQCTSPLIPQRSLILFIHQEAKSSNPSTTF